MSAEMCRSHRLVEAQRVRFCRGCWDNCERRQLSTRWEVYVFQTWGMMILSSISHTTFLCEASIYNWALCTCMYCCMRVNMYPITDGLYLFVVTYHRQQYLEAFTTCTWFDTAYCFRDRHVSMESRHTIYNDLGLFTHQGERWHPNSPLVWTVVLEKKTFNVASNVQIPRVCGSTTSLILPRVLGRPRVETT